MAPRAAGTDESPGGAGTTPGTAPRRAGYRRGTGVGGSAASRSDTLGRGAPQLSRSLGAPLADAASLPSLGLDASDVYTSWARAHGHGGGDRGVRAVPSVAGPA